MARILALLVSLLAQDVDIGRILAKADALLEESKAAYEKARSTASVPAFVEAGFKLEEARIKYLVLQEIGDAKIAAERLRAVNQLNKLINDGKVAVMNPLSTPKASDPTTPAVPAAPPPPAVDVSKRAPVPDPSRQKESEKLVRELFKEDYAKKAPGDRKALGRKLLEEAGRNIGDPASCWALCREAEELAIQLGDVQTALAAVERRAERFDIDPLAAREASFGALAKSVKSAEDAATMAEALVRHADDLVAADQYENAEKAAFAALGYARKAADADLAARASARSRELVELKALFLGQKGVLDKLAKDGDDPGANLEMGKFLCFAKGSWDLGLRFIVKGSDPALKVLAQKQLEYPVAVEERVALADGWFDLGEKEKSTLRKGRLLEHARSIYEEAAPAATGLLRAKIAKRLEALPRGASKELDLLSFVDATRDAVTGDWAREGRTLVSPFLKYARLEIPYTVPDEYDLTLEVVRQRGDLALAIGMVWKGRQFTMGFDGYEGTTSGLTQVDGVGPDRNETNFKGKLIPSGKPVTLRCMVRESGILVTVDGKKVVDWKGPATRLSLLQAWQVKRGDTFFLGTYDAVFTIRKMRLVTISGQGSRIR